MDVLRGAAAHDELGGELIFSSEWLFVLITTCKLLGKNTRRKTRATLATITKHQPNALLTLLSPPYRKGLHTDYVPTLTSTSQILRMSLGYIPTPGTYLATHVPLHLSSLRMVIQLRTLGLPNANCQCAMTANAAKAQLK